MNNFMFGLSPSISFGDDTDCYLSCNDDLTNRSNTSDSWRSSMIDTQIATPTLRETSKKSDMSKDNDVVNGVETNPLIQELFHVNFLPFDDRLVHSLHNQDENDEFDSLEEMSSMSDDDEDEEDHRLHNLGTAKKSNREKDRRHNLIGLRRRLTDSRRISKFHTVDGVHHHRSEKKISKKERKNYIREKKKVRRQKRLEHLSSQISTEVHEMERAKIRLSEVKATLKSTQSESKRIMIEALKSSNRITKLATTITELECKLDMAMRALEHEQNKTFMNVNALDNLYASQELLEQEACALESLLNKQLQISDSGFVTESEASKLGPPISRISSVSEYTSATEDEAREPSAEGISLNEEENTVTAFLRIHDLNIPTEVDGKELQLYSGSRKDLHSLGHCQRHHILNALSNYAYKVITNEGEMWTADSSTKKTIDARPPEKQKWHFVDKIEDVFVWYGNLGSGGYKADLPVIKARGLVLTSAENLVSLLLDSTKVKQYNKMSLGREDRVFLKKGLNAHDGKLMGEVKIVRSVSSIPMIRKQIEIISVMYAKKLNVETDGMNGYLIVNRSIWEQEHHAPLDTHAGHEGDDQYIRCEMLLGVNLIRALDGDNDGKCELTTVTHFFTPGAPTFGARQFGMKAAANFIRDLQKQFELC